MIWEFIVYPHEICWRPQETRSSAYDKKNYIASYVDTFTFLDLPSPTTSRLTGDIFDDSCTPDSIYAQHAREILKGLCDTFIDLNGGQYAFNLHNRDGKKPHFHVVFCMPFGKSLNEHDVYRNLGMYRYIRDDFTHGKSVFERYSYEYPVATCPRYKVWEDFMRSDRLRYLCHLDIKKHSDDYRYASDDDGKVVYSYTDVVASFDYMTDPDVVAPAQKNQFAIFLTYKKLLNLDKEYKFYEWLANSKLDENTIKKFYLIKTQIHYYYQSLRYEKAF